MSSSQKVNRSRYNLKDILSIEWDTSEIPDFSDQEMDKLYSLSSRLSRAKTLSRWNK